MKIGTRSGPTLQLPRASRLVAAITIGTGLAFGLAACGPSTSTFPGQQTPTSGPSNPQGKKNENTVFGPGGLTIPLIGGGSSSGSNGGAAPAIGVNSFLWRASLDTVSFMPLQSADPFGGVIITDWYANPQAPDERFKVTIYILDKRLRADGVKVSVFRQVKNTAGQWEDATADPALPANLENAILSRARQLRINANADS